MSLVMFGVFWLIWNMYNLKTVAPAEYFSEDCHKHITEVVAI